MDNTYMIRVKKRGTNEWYSIMDYSIDAVREFSNENAHKFKEQLEANYHKTHTYNVYPYDASAI